jgi:hypothetical protein
MSDGSNKNSCSCTKVGCSGGPSCCGMPAQTLVRGILALCFGLLFLGFAYRVIVRIVFFGVGVGLVYYGFRVLGITQVTEGVDSVVARIRRLFEL